MTKLVGYSVTVWVGAEHFHEFTDAVTREQLADEELYWLNSYGARAVDFDAVWEDEDEERWVEGGSCAVCDSWDEE